MNPFQNVYIRLLTYAMSMLLSAIPAAWAGWIFIESAADGWVLIHVQIEGMMTVLFGSGGIVASVFRIWGTK